MPGVVVGFVYRARKQRVQLAAALAVQDLQRDAAQVFAHFAACRIARAGAVALVIIILRALAEQSGEREQYGEQRQPKRCTTVFARAQRQKGRQQYGKPRALQQRGGDLYLIGMKPYLRRKLRRSPYWSLLGGQEHLFESTFVAFREVCVRLGIRNYRSYMKYLFRDYNRL